MKKDLNLTLVLMRHGIAVEPMEFGGSDALRPLTVEGIEKTGKIAHTMLQIIKPDMIISSDYKRAVQTAEIVAEGLGGEFEVHKTPALRPGARWEDWLRYLQGAHKQLKTGATILAVGHEPTISEFLAGHLGQEPGAGLWKMKKAGIAVLQLYSWNLSELLAFVPPKWILKV